MSRTITVQDINVKENGGTSEMETQTEDKEAAVTLCKLFRFSTPGDIFLIVLATVTALATGCIYPFAFILLGRAVSAFIAMESGALTNGTDPLDTMFASNLYNSILCYVLGAVILLVGYISFTSFGCVAERQSKHIRYQFFRSVLRQNIAWFETHKTGELNTTFTEDILCIYEGIGIKLCNFLQFLSTWLSSIIAGIVLGWKLALAGISFSPFILVFSALTFRYLRKVIKEEIESYKNAGNIANETFAAIRTVHAFQGQEKQAVRYDSNIGGAKETGGKKGLVMGFNLGIFWALYFVDYAVLTWYAVHLVQAENLNPGDMLSVMALVVRGSGTLGFALPYIEILSVSLEAARKVFAVIDTVPAIDSGSQHGHKPQNVLGNIEFRRVCFNYPSRKNVQVLRSLNLTIPKGKVVALVGPSGSGKSTIVQLLQRFYDPLEGMICMDGHNIRDLNINWLRHQFGVVSQEPVLFDTTISENILCGNIDMNKYLVEKAARDANAHDFISQLPKGYDTVVGGRGAQLSGGQRQRIAIARALVRDPRILLLDEATSALDNQSEALVQKALEQAQKGRTTIVIAHRLSTVKNADVIVAVSQGQVVEQGTHDELIVQGGLYTKLVEHQTYTGDLETEGDKQLGVKEKAVQDVVTSPLNETPLFEEGHCYKDTVGKDDQKVMEDKPKGQIVKRLLQLNTPEWPSLLLGGFGAIVCGVVMPGFAVVISDFSRVLGLKPEEQSEGTTVVSVSMVGLGAVFVLAKISQSYGFARSGAALTARVRSMTFRSIVNQDMDFFDEPENEVGFLTTRLASDAQLLQLTTVHIGTLLESLSAVASILIILFISDWKLSLATVGFMPLLIITGFLEAKLDMGFTDTAKTKTCGKIFTEATDNIRTVASLCRENTFLKKYEDVISHVLRDGVKRSFIQGLTHGSGLCLFFWTFGTSLLYGSYLVQNEGLQYYIVIRIFSTVVFGSTQVGRLSGFHGDYGRGKEAAGRLFSLIDRPRVINVNTTRSEALVNYNGALSLKNLRYCYKSRPSVPVLNGFSLDIQPGHTVALVGSSGSGKSTVIQLIERFYDVENGVVLADNTPLPNLDLKWWRSQLALVSQEPILFDSSIADNIAYGDNSRVVSMEEIIAAARMANIHTFIEALPLGYETNVGSHGTQLSGGQKQRVAIARALIRNPKVLLLDEATSSLDSESERIIQETLDKAREGRTCIVIAHRLSTVQNSDKIAVLKQGEIIEVGSHSELLAMQGEYFKQISASERAYNL